MKHEAKNIIEEADAVQKNVDWWITEVSKACDDIDDIDSNPNLSQKEIENRFSRLEYLVGKADTEIKSIDDLEQKSINYFKKLYEESESQNGRVVKRKKRKLS
tara:strand:+ start:3560 stop:3868 length:309 start_codon:yes stop_codon:yes gene_type:complete